MSADDRMHLDGRRVVVPFRDPKLRTEEQIAADLEARYAEMEAEAARRAVDPQLNFPCATCRFYEADYYGFTKLCRCPLVVGFGGPYKLKDWAGEHSLPPLCGPEKALWRAKLTLWQRFIEWLSR